MNAATRIDHKLLSGKVYFVIQGCIFIAVAILYILSFFIKFNPSLQARKDASGFEHQYASKFFYFYYYTGYFPLATLDTNLTYSKTAANHEMNEDGKDLIMEYKHWSRLGEHARILCYMPGGIVKSSAEAPSVRLFNAIFFLLGLMCLYRGFYKVHKPLIGLLLCISILLTPYFHYEVFQNENIFALPASVFFMISGLLLPFLFRETKLNFRTIIVLFLSCAIIAFCSEIRNEISVVFLSTVLILILSSYIQWGNKIILISFAVIFFMGTKKTIQAYFEHQFQRTKQLVSSKDGHVYNGKKISGHKFWHPVFCGLGDYDTRYGYMWSDTVAYDYAVPVLNTRYGLNLKYSGKLYTDNYYDSAKLYYIKFDEIPQYENVVKEKVIGDIKNDPLWYAGILLKRFVRICTTTLPFPFLGFITCAGLLLFSAKRRWMYIKLIMITLPLSVTSFVIYSGKGATYNSLFGYFILAILLYEALKLFPQKKETTIN